MHERRRPEQGDVTAPTEGDYSFPDWDNPEDADEDWDEGAPQGYYDDAGQAEDDDYWPDENDPDFDLSEAAGYSDWEPSEGGFPQWLIVAVSLLLIFAILIPLVLQGR
jgi:hypothetical protein